MVRTKKRRGKKRFPQAGNRLGCRRSNPPSRKNWGLEVTLFLSPNFVCFVRANSSSRSIVGQIEELEEGGRPSSKPLEPADLSSGAVGSSQRSLIFAIGCSPLTGLAQG